MTHSNDCATHRFAANVAGYDGWEWHVVLACVPGSRHITVNEITLMPGRDALVAPDWVPWRERIRPGDLAPGYVMPPSPDDRRLIDAPTGKTLSTHGLGGALKRWRTGSFGPEASFSENAEDVCDTCAFYVPVEKPAGEDFGVCLNEYSADGHIVHAHYGCGAHSNTPPVEPRDPLPQHSHRRIDPYTEWEESSLA